MHKLTKVLQNLYAICHCGIQIKRGREWAVRHDYTPQFINIFDDMLQSVCGLLEVL